MTLLESMCQGNFMGKSEEEAWGFLEEIAEKTVQWETTSDNATPSRGKHVVETSVVNQAKMVALIQSFFKNNL